MAPHSDNFNFLLTCHVGLRVPKEGCYFTMVGGQMEQDHGPRLSTPASRSDWHPGKLIVADTSFVHSTTNASPEDRFVLAFAVWHPGLTPLERDTVMEMHTAMRNFEDELTGVIEAIL